ncbi:MAG: DUF1573 domain-containing protein [Clostridiales bacterium]|nr:DUF1573 domain-containing protein [Clostridiales bacterium]MCF8023634.1 DUF1573 domain-containing protein [Clostridiales bacterium]
MLKDTACKDLQDTVSDLLLYHRSVLDILSKNQECSAKLQRSIIKAVTSCGCIKIDAQKDKIPQDATLPDLKHILNTHIKGNLCHSCRENIEDEIGRLLFYIAALCNSLDIDLYDVMIKEKQNLKTLGIYNLA